MKSPYHGTTHDQWESITQKIIEKHPLKPQEIVDVVLMSWNTILDTGLGKKGFKIGVDIFPKPQIMGFFLHELIPLELAARYPEAWRGEKQASDKDIVYIPDDSFSIEVKTSSNPNRIFGNRSYAQGTTNGKKAKTGYYVAVNFEKFSATTKQPQVCLIRFGWLDANDWIGQKAATGQQSRLPAEVENFKLLKLYSKG
jgi:hypothetical protein